MPRKRRVGPRAPPLARGTCVSAYECKKNLRDCVGHQNLVKISSTSNTSLETHGSKGVRISWFPHQYDTLPRTEYTYCRAVSAPLITRLSSSCMKSHLAFLPSGKEYVTGPCLVHFAGETNRTNYHTYLRPAYSLRSARLLILGYRPLEPLREIRRAYSVPYLVSV